MNIQEKAIKILQQPVCDHCLGRQFGQLLSGFTNEERGRAIRTAAAIAIDSGEKGADMSNFSGFIMRNAAKEKPKKCSVCLGMFENLDKYAGKIAKRGKGVEFSTFLVGTRPSSELVEAEEAIWERAGIEFCEPIKAELNREIGKLVEKKTGKKFSPTPDITFITDISSGSVKREITPLFVYAEYQKLKRGIPQTRWPSGKYKTSVEQIIAKPFMKKTKGVAHKLHGSGREDIDALCLAWRPFVLEILEPVKRRIDLKKIRVADKRVNVRSLRFSDIKEVRRIKEVKLDKTYRALVKCAAPLQKRDLTKLASLKTIMQQTPQRVLHRRANLIRKRSVREIKAKIIDKKTMTLVIRGESGLYIKELISGDNGRTKPSVSEVLGVPCVCKQLEVIKIHTKK